MRASSKVTNNSILWHVYISNRIWIIIFPGQDFLAHHAKNTPWHNIFHILSLFHRNLLNIFLFSCHHNIVDTKQEYNYVACVPMTHLIGCTQFDPPKWYQGPIHLYCTKSLTYITNRTLLKLKAVSTYISDDPVWLRNVCVGSQVCFFQGRNCNFTLLFT